MCFAAAALSETLFPPLLLFLFVSVLLSRPSSPERRRVSHALARPALFPAADSGSNLRLLLYFLSWLVFCWHDAHAATKESFGFAAATRKGVSVPWPGVERLPGKATPGEEKHLGKSLRECETRRLEVSDGSLCPNLKQGGRKALCIAFQRCSYRFIFASWL